MSKSEDTKGVAYPLPSDHIIDFLRAKYPEQLQVFPKEVIFAHEFVDDLGGELLIMKDALLSEMEIAEILSYTLYSLFDFEEYVVSQTKFLSMVRMSLLTPPYKKK